MFDKFTNKENLSKLWKRTKDVAKVIGNEATESFKNIKEKVKEKSEDWDDLVDPASKIKEKDNDIDDKKEDIKVEDKKDDEKDKKEDIKVEDKKDKKEDVKVEDKKDDSKDENKSK